ncbi:hypothetical protein AS026_21085 [Rhizobium altiplani]|uniref:Uncharacterized protein n=1 Tax=Rhizobium altiplani TaxID=1864509 RepID=A0A120FF19_9HYPH|nr:hypothetical protein [Rhizobium altiplani]KWV42107.1 hypothetical protein AS026_21085 [Rhizobium altiplani]
MLKDILERIEARLKVVGLDATNASLQAKLSKDAIRNLQRAVKRGDLHAGVSSSTLQQLAPVLQTTAAWLLEGTDCGTQELPPSMRRLWDMFVAAREASPEVQLRIADFAEFQLRNYEKSRETATNIVS